MSKPGARRVRASYSQSIEIALWLNVALVWVWFALHTGVGDRIGAVGALDMFAMYYFVPLALAFPYLIYRRAAALGAAWVASMLLFLWIWHGLFLPGRTEAHEASATLRVMTYNVLGTHDDYQSMIDNIRGAHADVVFLQEVNPDFARRIASELIAEYPYQVLDPKPGVNGMGTISRHPLHSTGDSLGLVWVGTPQLLTLDWNATRLSLVNFHTLPPRLSYEVYMRENFAIRNEQARAIAAYVERRIGGGPVVCAGDLNAVQVSTAYATMRSVLQDAWLDGAIGPGHTFPSHTVIPPRMFRIDYIFVSPGVTTRRAFLARNEGRSDHRGVVADLAITTVTASE